MFGQIKFERIIRRGEKDSPVNLARMRASKTYIFTFYIIFAALIAVLEVSFFLFI